MTRRIAYFLALLIPAAIGGCGNNPTNRQLMSISVSPATTSNRTTAFTATGTFNTPPYTVTPLSVSWNVEGGDIDPGGDAYSLTNVSYAVGSSVPCGSGSSDTVIAVAPAAQNAPISGFVPTQTFSDLVLNHNRLTEGGFVAGTAQLTCP